MQPHLQTDLQPSISPSLQSTHLYWVTLICIHSIWESRSWSPCGITGKIKRHGLSWEAHQGQKNKARYAAPRIILSAFRGIAGDILKAYHLANSHFPNIPWKHIPELQIGEKSCQKEKNGSAKILCSVLPNMSIGNMVAKCDWANTRIFFQWC